MLKDGRLEKKQKEGRWTTCDKKCPVSLNQFI